jgi:hypothetical protein
VRRKNASLSDLFALVFVCLDSFVMPFAFSWRTWFLCSDSIIIQPSACVQ